MPKILPNVFTYEQMQQKWLQDIEEGEDPYTRRSDLQTGRYALDKWLIRVDDEGKTLAVLGWKEHSNHTVCGGGLTTERGKQIRGNMKALMAARKSQIPQDKMMVTALVHRSGNNARWLAFGRGQLYRFPNDEGFEEYANQLPPAVKEDWLSAYPETFGVKPVNPTSAPEGVEKTYYDMDFYVMSKNERYIRELGKSGYNIIDTTTNKKINTIGLSKSQAKHMIQLLKEGKSVWDYTKPRHSRWKRQLRKSLSTWKNIIKIDPNSGGYEPLPYGDIQNQHVDNPYMGKVVDGVAIIFNAHYHYKYKNRKRIRLTIMTDALARKFTALGASLGSWCYINDDVKDFSYVMFDRLTNENNKIKRTNPVKTVKSLGQDPATKLPITQAVVFHHVNDGHDSPLPDKKVDIYYKGIKPGHLTKISATRKKPKKPTDDPVNIFAQNKNTPSRNKKGNNNQKRRGSRNQQGRNKEAEFQRNRRRR